MAEIRRTSKQLNTAEVTERNLMRKIIMEWKDIKQIRMQQGYTNTSVKLIVKKKEVRRVKIYRPDIYIDIWPII